MGIFHGPLPRPGGKAKQSLGLAEYLGIQEPWHLAVEFPDLKLNGYFTPQFTVVVWGICMLRNKLPTWVCWIVQLGEPLQTSHHYWEKAITCCHISTVKWNKKKKILQARMGGARLAMKYVEMQHSLEVSACPRSELLEGRIFWSVLSK